MRISLDFDEVLFPFMKPFLAWVNPRLPHHGIHKTLVTADVVEYNLYPALEENFARDLIDTFYTTPELQKIIPERYASAGVDSLLQAGHEIVIVTGRPSSCDKETRLQLLTHRFPELQIYYSNQYFENKVSKAEICQNLKIDIHVDDQVKHINEVIDRGMSGIFIKTPTIYTTPLSSNAMVAENWLDILKFIARCTSSLQTVPFPQ
jgi:hypothetical protein